MLADIGPSADSSAIVLRLLSEEPESIPGASFEGSRDVELDVPFGSACWFVGPLPERVTAKQVRSRFHQQLLSAELLANPQPGGTVHAIVLGPLETSFEAEQKVRALQLAGFASAKFVDHGSSYQVQVGHYDTLAESEVMLEALHSEGFNAQVRKQSSEISAWLLRVVLEGGQEVPIALWRSLEKDFTRLKRENNWCGAIASVT